MKHLATLATLALVVGTAFPCAAPASTGRTPAPLASQQPSPEPAQGTADQPGTVHINVLVTDEDGRAISGLKQENFRVLDNGKPQVIRHLSPTTDPIHVVLLLEYSSVAYGYYAGKAAAWASRFVDHLEPRDWVAVMTYDLNTTVRADFTHNQVEVRDALATLGMPAYTDSNLFDGLLDTVEKTERLRGRKAILLMTTGANGFSAATFDDVIRRLRSTDVTIFCIGLAEEEAVRSLNPGIAYQQARTFLRTFSEQTGGIAWFPRFPAEISEISRSITGFLRSEYTLSFSPPDSARDGKYHRLKIQVVAPDGKPLTIANRSGKQRKLTVTARQGYQLAPLEEATH